LINTFIPSKSKIFDRRHRAASGEGSASTQAKDGQFDHPSYNDGEAFLGKLAACWKANYRHFLLALNRPRFVNKDGSSQWQDPRFQDVALPDGWYEGQDHDGYP